jgi:hypothetical protein
LNERAAAGSRRTVLAGCVRGSWKREVPQRQQGAEIEATIFQLPLHVIKHNLPPQIISAPHTQAVIGQPWRYQVYVRNPDQDPLTYVLDPASLAAGFSVSDRGLIQWTPAAAIPTGHSVVLTVRDGKLQDPFNPDPSQVKNSFGLPIPANEVRQAFTITTQPDAPADSARPIIRSLPTGVASLGKTFEYQVIASAPTGSTLTYAVSTTSNDNLGSGADYPTISSTGLLTWNRNSAAISDEPIHANLTVTVSNTSASPVVATTQSWKVSWIKPYRLNIPPEFVSTPKHIGYRDAHYQYTVAAIDENDDPLVYSLLKHPEQMSIDPNSGTISWTPRAAGVFEVIVQVDDGGFQRKQAFDLVVQQNAPPQVGIVPAKRAYIGQPLLLDLRAESRASDPNFGETATLVYQKVRGPTGLTVSTTGQLAWTPTNGAPIRFGGDLGIHTLSVSVTDIHGASTLISDIEIQVLQPGHDHAPVFVSRPRDTVPVLQRFEYQSLAVDDDGDSITFALVPVAGLPLPAGLQLTSTGLLTWTPTLAQVRATPYPFQILATSARDNLSTLSPGYEITVTRDLVNVPPRITSLPKTAATVGYRYLYQATAVDDDHDALAWSLVNGPVGMTIDSSSGLVSWEPTTSDLGANVSQTTKSFSIAVSDPYGATSIQAATLVLRPTNLAPVIDSFPPTLASLGQDYFYPVVAKDPDQGDLTYAISHTLPTNTPAVNLPTFVSGSQTLRWRPADALVGTVVDLRITVTDDRGAAVTQQWPITIYDPAVNLPPVFTSQPRPFAIVGQPYSYPITVVDPPVGPPTTITITAPTLPSYLTLNQVGAAMLVGTPTLVHTGTQVVRIEASDNAPVNPLTQSQTYPLTVRPNSAPRFSPALSNITIVRGQTLRLPITAVDDDGDRVVISPTTVLPSGMTFADRWLTWTVPQEHALEAIDVGMVARDYFADTNWTLGYDGYSSEDSRVFQVDVLADTVAPSILLSFDRNPVINGLTARLSLLATDDVGVSQLTLKARLSNDPSSEVPVRSIL